MQFIKKYFWQLLCFLLILFLFIQKSCNFSKYKNIIITKSKTGSFNYSKPEEIKNNIKYKYTTLKGDTIELENPINIELANKYKKETDSLKKEILFYQAIQQRTYKKDFEDKNLKATIFAKTTGTLDSVKLDYLIKPDTIKIKQPVFSLLGGLSLQTNINTLQPNLKVNIGFQNKKKDILLLGGNNKEINITYLKNIFTIKK